MKKYLLPIFTFLFSFLSSIVLLAQGNGNGGGSGGNNNGGNRYEITGNQQPCVGSIETYTIMPDPGTAVVWDWDGPRAQPNEVAWELISFSNNKATFRVGDKPGTIRAKPTPGSNNTENLPVHPGRSVQVAINGPSAVCVNAQQEYQVVINNLNRGKKNGKDINLEDLDISWSVSGFTIVSGQGTGKLTVKSTSGFTSGQVSVTVNVPGQSGSPNNNGKGVGPITGFCGGNANASVQVGLSTNCTAPCPATTVSISGPAQVCPTPTDYELSDLPLYSAVVNNGTTSLAFNWVLPNGWQIASGAGTKSIRVRVGNTPGQIKVNVTNGCSATPATASQMVAFSNNCPNPTSECPASTVTISGPETVCPSQSDAVFYTAVIMNGTAEMNYNWSVPNGWLIKNGQGSNSIEVLVGNTAGQISLTVHNECGNSASDIQAVAFGTDCGSTPPACLAPQVNITGPATVCPEQTQAVTFTAGVANATAGMEYIWQVPNGWLLKSGQGTNAIQVLVGNTAGQISLTVTNNCNKTATDTHAVTFRNSCGNTPPACPTPQVSITGPNQVCAFADEPVAYTANVTNGSANLEYVWTVPADWFIIAGETTNTIEVLVGFESGSVSVSVTNLDCGQTGSNSVSVLTLEDCSSLEPLPVELISFAGESEKSGVLLTWSTASEKNNDYFELERSRDGKHYAKVGQLKGKGTTNSRQQYSFRDNRAAQGTIYYRLKQVDLNGAFEYSKVIVVNHSYGATQANLAIMPNPVSSGQFTLRLPDAANQAQVEIMDMNGRLITSQVLDKGVMEASFSTQTLNLQTGMYLIKYTNGSQVSHTKMMIR